MKMSKQNISGNTMKQYLLFLLLISAFAQAQIINFPDANFKARLLAANPSNNIATTNPNPFINTYNTTIDVNGNGEIEVFEASLLTRLDINGSNIANIEGIQYFTNLIIFHCYTNQITQLDVTTMPNLINLSCSYNLISNPMDLSQCPNLKSASIYHNQIPSVNLTGLTELINLFHEVNPLTSIDLSDLVSLKYYNGNFLDLTTLDFSNCPLIETISCQTNSLTAINLSNTANLKYINCGLNELTMLDVTDCINLENLQASYNNISDIAISNLTKLTSYGCADNPITSIDVSNQMLLQSLACGSPELTTLNLKNGSNEIFTLLNSPNLEYICADDNQLASVQAEANSDGNPNVVVTSYCTFIPGGDYNTITGLVSYDVDNDGCDADDIKANYLRLNIGGAAAGATYINGAGNYIFYTGTGDYTITPQLEQPSYFNVTPVAATANFPMLDNSTIVRDFCLTANGFHPDMEIVVLPLRNAVAGFEANYQLVYKNKGNQIMSGQVTLNFEGDKLNFVSADTMPNSQTDNILTWSYNNLLPFEVRTINLWLAVNAPTDEPAVNAGDVLHFYAEMNFVTDDPTPADNYFMFDQVVANAHDPNNKTCLEGEIVTPEKIGEYLHYNINFENIGTTEATNVVIKDLINTNQFDLSTLQIMYASHPVRILVTGNKVEFIFENINLPSAISNPIGGHGNVLFKIKTLPTLPIGTMVSNTANIYFDYNHPIETNEARTTFNLLSTKDFDVDSSVSVYPNPVKNQVHIEAKSNIKSVQFFDIQGRILEVISENNTKTILDISGKSKGIYFLKITTETGSKVEKLVKE